MTGKKLWSTFVEPPWEYVINNDTIFLDVTGIKTDFPIEQGPPP